MPHHRTTSEPTRRTSRTRVPRVINSDFGGSDSRSGRGGRKGALPVAPIRGAACPPPNEMSMRVGRASIMALEARMSQIKLDRDSERNTSSSGACQAADLSGALRAPEAQRPTPVPASRNGPHHVGTDGANMKPRRPQAPAGGALAPIRLKRRRPQSATHARRASAVPSILARRIKSADAALPRPDLDVTELDSDMLALLESEVPAVAKSAALTGKVRGGAPNAPVKAKRRTSRTRRHSGASGRSSHSKSSKSSSESKASDASVSTSSFVAARGASPSNAPSGLVLPPISMRKKIPIDLGALRGDADMGTESDVSDESYDSGSSPCAQRMALYVSDEEEDGERYSTHRRSSWIFRPEDILTASREGALAQLESAGDDLYEGVLIDDSVIIGESDIESEGKAMPPPTSRPPAVTVDTSFMDDVLATSLDEALSLESPSEMARFKRASNRPTPARMANSPAGQPRMLNDSPTMFNELLSPLPWGLRNSGTGPLAPKTPADIDLARSVDLAIAESGILA